MCIRDSLYLSNWGNFNGQKEALTEEDEDCLENKREISDPSSQALFIEFTRPIFDQVSKYIEAFYGDY